MCVERGVFIKIYYFYRETYVSVCQGRVISNLLLFFLHWNVQFRGSITSSSLASVVCDKFWGIQASRFVQLNNDLLLGARLRHAHVRSGACCSSCKVNVLRMINLFTTNQAHLGNTHFGCASLLLESQELDVGHGMDVVIRLAGLLCCHIVNHRLLSTRCLHFYFLYSFKIILTKQFYISHYI